MKLEPGVKRPAVARLTSGEAGAQGARVREAADVRLRAPPVHLPEAPGTVLPAAGRKPGDDRIVERRGAGAAQQREAHDQPAKPARLACLAAFARQLQRKHSNLGGGVQISVPQRLHIPLRMRRACVHPFGNAQDVQLASGVHYPELRPGRGSASLRRYSRQPNGLGVGDVHDVALRDRRHLSEDGVLIVVATLAGSNGRLSTGPPELIARGFADSGPLIEEMRYEASRVLQGCLDENIVEIKLLQEHLHDGLGQLIYDRTGRRPMILPVVVEV